jgi:predicted ATPase
MDNIFTVSRPFLEFFRLVGLFPMAFDGPDRRGILRVSWLGIVTSVILISWSVAVNILTILYKGFSRVQDQPSGILLAGATSSVMFESFSLIFIIFYQLFKRKKILTFLRNVDRVDKKVIVFCDLTQSL